MASPRSHRSIPRKPDTSVQSMERLRSRPGQAELVVILAPDMVRRERAEDQAIEILRRKEKRSDVLVTRHGGELPLRALEGLIVEIGTLSLFSSSKILLIRHAQNLDAATIKRLSQWLETLPSHLNVIVSASKLPAQHQVFKLASKNGTVIDFPELSGAELVTWTRQECGSAGISNTTDALAQTISSIGEENPDRIHSVINQLALFLDGKELTHADLEKLFHFQAEVNEFELIEKLTRGSPGTIEQMSTSILRSGKSPFPLLGLIYRTFSNYLSLRTHLSAGRNPAELASLCGMPPWLVNKQLPAVKAYSQEKLHAAVRAILTADAKLKNRSLGPEAIMSELFSELRP